MSREALTRQTLSDRIANQLRLEIISGRFPSGSRLPSQYRLAADFEISINVLREALRRLEGEGFIEIRHGKGTFVRDALAQGTLGRLDSWTLFEARFLLELGVIEQVIQRIDDAGLARLQGLLEEAASAVAAGDSIVSFDMKLHLTLAELAGNPAIAQVSQLLVEDFRRSLAEYVPPPGYDEWIQRENQRAHEEHCRLVEYIRAGDLEGARATLREHFSTPRVQFLMGQTRPPGLELRH